MHSKYNPVKRSYPIFKLQNERGGVPNEKQEVGGVLLANRLTAGKCVKEDRYVIRKIEYASLSRVTIQENTSKIRSRNGVNTFP